MLEQTKAEKTEIKIPTTLKALIEALIFAAHEPLSINQIRAIYQGESVCKEPSQQIEPETIRKLIADLNNEYEKLNRPYRIIQIAGGYQFATLSDYADWLGKLYKEQGKRKLSQSGVETLSIVAYKQPVTKSEIENIRGVNCDYVLKTLLEKELVTVTGRAETVGRPLLYGTTKEFLKHFGLNDITDLPRPREIEEILGESQFETERRMLEAQAGAEKISKEQEDFKSRLPHIPKKKPNLEEKEVEIIQQRRTREIKIVSSEDHKSLEEAGQETIEFVTQNSAQTSDISNTSNVVNSDNNVTYSEDNTEKESLEKIETVRLEETQYNELHIESEKNVVVQETKEQEDKIGEILSSQKEAENIPQEVTPPAISHPPKRWQVWKEKIKVLIKKLFV